VLARSVIKNLTEVMNVSTAVNSPVQAASGNLAACVMIVSGIKIKNSGGEQMHLIVALTGASGIDYGVTLLKNLYTRSDVSVDLIISEEGKELLKYESNTSFEELTKGALNIYNNNDIAAGISSGSKLFDAMVIVPCSMSTLSKIANGLADNLITRVASVALKERRNLIVVPRETPLSTIQLENMAALSRSGACVLPAMPAFYPKPADMQDIMNFVAGKVLDQLGLENDLYNRWSDE
jgi:4-hydroxy-3-polyprenylbenzoate decarboxylase